MQLYWIWYSLLPGLSLRQKHLVLEYFSSPEDVYNTQDYSCIPEAAPGLVQALSDKDMTHAQQVFNRCRREGIGILSMDDPKYPRRLRHIPDPPLVLYYKGILPDFENMPAIAVVGTRKASCYGNNMAREISLQIAACGALVVSGGAYGIDTMALDGALNVGGQTVAVLGCGVDIAYPPSNRKLFQTITQNGCLMSEYTPGTKPNRWQFPERNRIVSGMSNGVLVVEAPEISGALITARMALEQGRDVYVVPGNIDVTTCRGSNALLREGAGAVFSGWDIVKEYAAQYPQVAENRQTPQTVPQKQATPMQELTDKKSVDNPIPKAYSVKENNTPELTEQEQAVINCLDTIPRPLDQVSDRAGIPAAVVSGVITKLTLKGYIANHPGKMVSLRK